MGMELRIREPRAAEGVAPLRGVWSEEAVVRGVFWTSLRNWSLFILGDGSVWWPRGGKMGRKRFKSWTGYVAINLISSALPRNVTQICYYINMLPQLLTQTERNRQDVSIIL